MKAVLNKFNSDTLIITLHGTGGHASQLFELATLLSPQATLLGLEGNVSENGLRRYFERYPNGSFNEESLTRETENLYQAIQDNLKEAKLTDKEIIILGYSNGANILVNLMKTYRLNLKAALLFHPSATRPDVPFIPQDYPVFLTYGDHDTYVTKEAFLDLEASLSKANIKNTTFMHEYGHSLLPEEIETAKQFLKQI